MICCCLSLAHSPCILLLTASAAGVPLGKAEREGDRQADRQRVEGETAQQPPTAPTQIYYLCSRSGHFTAVFTLDPDVRIRWQGPGLQMWLPIHRSATFLSTDPPAHILIRPLTLLIKKIPTDFFLETIIHSTIQSQSLIWGGFSYNVMTVPQLGRLRVKSSLTASACLNCGKTSSAYVERSTGFRVYVQPCWQWRD